jgi:ketosteroid isomerase-like protein
MNPNVDLAERLIAAFQRWDRDAIAEIIHADAVIDVSVRVVDGGIFRGPDGAMEQYRKWMGAFDGYKWELEELIPAGERVVVVFREGGRGKGSGVPIDHRGAVIWRIAGGQVIEFKTYLDLAKAFRAAGLEPPADQ